MPPIEIKPVKITELPKIEWSSERPILHLPEISSPPSLVPSDFFPLRERITKFNPSENWAARLQSYQITETGLVPIKNNALVPVKKEVLALRPPFLERYSWDLGGLLGGAFTGGVVGGILYLCGVGMVAITAVASAIALIDTSFGLMAGWFSRAGGAPGFEIPVDHAGNHYAIGTYPEPWLPIRQNGDLIAYPLSVTRIEGRRVEASFKIFGMEEPFKLTMSESYARHRKLIPDKEFSLSNDAYYLILGPPRKEWLERLRRMLEEEKGRVLPFRLPARSTPVFAGGAYVHGQQWGPVNIYRPGDEPLSLRGRVRPIGTLEVRRWEHTWIEVLRVHIQKFDPPLDARKSEEFFEINLLDAKRLGLVIQDSDGLLRENPESSYVFISEPQFLWQIRLN